MFVKPAAREVNGVPLKVRDPVSKLHIPAEGKEVPESSFWIRRLRSGDVVRCEPPSPPSPPESIDS